MGAATELMIDAAERIVAERGFSAMTVRAVQESAGQANKSAVQYHFGDRDGLIRAVLQRRMAVPNQQRTSMLLSLDEDCTLRIANFGVAQVERLEPRGDDVAYGEYQGYINVPASTYTLNVTPGNDNSNVVRAYDADISGLNGGAATVFASGFLGSEEPEDEFGVWVALPDGQTFPLTEIVSTQEVADRIPAFQLAPNPVRTTAQVQYTLSEDTDITIAIQNAGGQTIRSIYLGRQPAGEHSRTLEAGGLPQGMYTYSLVTPVGVLAQRFVVVK